MEINALEAWGKNELQFSTSELHRQVTNTRNNDRKKKTDGKKKEGKKTESYYSWGSNTLEVLEKL